MWCRRHAVQAFFRRSRLSINYRPLSTLKPRPACAILIPTNTSFRHQSPPNTIHRRRYISFTSSEPPESSATSDIEPLESGPTIEPEEYDQLLAHAEKCWPAPPSVPTTWSCNWSEWDDLTTYYWFSPYYLMLPQIEMHVNIQYATRGETRPILFSNERKSFVLAILNSTKYFLFDCPNSALYRIRDVRSDRQLVELLEKGDEALLAKLKAVEKSEEGEDVIQRILSRDETVIPLLAEKYLEYTPEQTTPMMESGMEELEVTPEEMAGYQDAFSKNIADGEGAPGVGQTSEEIEEARLDKELHDLERQMQELQSLSSTLSKTKEMSVRQFKRLIGREDGPAPEEQGLGQGRQDEYNQENFQVEDDVPPEAVEGLKDKYRTLMRRADEMIEQMEEFPLPCNHAVVRDVIDTHRELRDLMPHLQLRSAVEMGEHVVATAGIHLAKWKSNPEVVARYKPSSLMEEEMEK